MKFSRSYALVKRNLTLTYRGFDPLYDLYYWPVFDLMLWGFTSRWLDTSGTENVSLIWLTGIVFWQGCVRANIDMPLNFLIELWSNNVITLFASPLKLREWVVAAMLIGLVNTVTVVLFGCVMAYLMYGVNIFAVGWFLVPLFLLLLQSGWVFGFFSAGCIMIGGLKVQKLIWVLGWFFGPFSAIFYTLDSLPSWAYAVAKCIPMSYLFEGLRLYATTGILPVVNLLIAFVLNSLYGVGTLYFLVTMFNMSKQRGLARLESD